jgi:hypothetical protein
MMQRQLDTTDTDTDSEYDVYVEYGYICSGSKSRVNVRAVILSAYVILYLEASLEEPSKLGWRCAHC